MLRAELRALAQQVHTRYLHFSSSKYSRSCAFTVADLICLVWRQGLYLEGRAEEAPPASEIERWNVSRGFRLLNVVRTDKLFTTYSFQIPNSVRDVRRAHAAAKRRLNRLRGKASHSSSPERSN